MITAHMNGEERKLFNRFILTEMEVPENEDEYADFWEDNARNINELAYEFAAMYCIGASDGELHIHFADRVQYDKARTAGIDTAKINFSVVGMYLAEWLREYVSNDARAFRRGLSRR